MYTILIQGPLHSNAINNLSNYKKYTKNIIFSTWDNSDKTLLKFLRTQDVQIIKSKFHDPPCCNSCNGYYQIYSTLEGLKVIETEYVLKLRCDEYIENVNPLFQELEKYPEKFITSNYWMKPSSDRYFMVSDHIFAAKTKDLLAGFDYAMKICLDSPDYFKYNTEYLGVDDIVVEQIIFLSWLKQKGKYDISDPIKIMQDNIRIVPIQQCGQFEVRINQINKKFNSVKEIKQLIPNFIVTNKYA